MKKILFPTLLIATLIAGGVVALAIWRAAPATAQDSITEARKSYEQKDYQTAGIHVMNALQQDSRNREAHILLSEILTSQAQYNAAASQLMKLLEYYPNDREAKLRLGALYL